MSNTTTNTNRKAKSSTSKTSKTTKATKATKTKATKAKTIKATKTKTVKATKAKTVKAKLPVSKPASEVEVPRLEATRDSITQHFDKLIADLDAEVKNLRATKCTGAKFLKNVSKTVKGLKTKSIRVMGKKPKKRTNVNSGFLKQVAISKEMAKFIGCGADDLKSRVDVTKAICAYIKDHSLQNPKDKREIIPDSKLKKLLRIDKGDDPLTYYRVQSKLKPHFPRSK
jgi:chromatin remodeling complex protein RSC6